MAEELRLVFSFLSFFLLSFLSFLFSSTMIRILSKSISNIGSSSSTVSFQPVSLFYFCISYILYICRMQDNANSQKFEISNNCTCHKDQCISLFFSFLFFVFFETAQFDILDLTSVNIGKNLLRTSYERKKGKEKEKKERGKEK